MNSPDTTPAEFLVDTSQAAPLDTETQCLHLEELWNMRAVFTNHAADRFQAELELETAQQEHKRTLKKTWQTTVEIADELRRLARTIEASSSETPAPPPAEPGFFQKLFGSNEPSRETDSIRLGHCFHRDSGE